MKTAITIAAICVAANSWARVHNKPEDPSKLVCYGLQFQHGYECVCPAPLEKGPLIGDWNCYCGTQDFQTQVADVVALQDPTAKNGYACQCFVDREGRKTVWDEYKKECIAVQEHEKYPSGPIYKARHYSSHKWRN